MAITHDTRSSITAAADLVNTLPAHTEDGADGLPDVPALTAFTTAHEYSGALRNDDVELAEVRAVRPRLRALWDATDDVTLVALTNTLLREQRALPQLVRHDGWDWHVHAVADDRPLAERIAVETAYAVVDLVRAGETGRLRTCAADDCDAVLVDLSRNRSRRYCDTGNCANRVHVAAYRARRAADA